MNGIQTFIKKNNVKCQRVRNCPFCNIPIQYQSDRSYKIAVLKNTICLKCHNIKQKRYADNMVKKCPSCNNEMYYTSKRNRNVSIRSNKLCASCAQKGNKNPMYGRKWTYNYRMKMNEIFHRPDVYIKFSKTMPSTTGNNNPAKRPEVRKKISKVLKNLYKLFPRKCGVEHPSYGKRISEDIKRKMRLAAINRVSKQKFFGGQVIPAFNIDSCHYLDKLSKERGWNLQHATNGGEYYLKDLGYWVDGYDKDKNIVVEYDEPDHYYNNQLKEKSISRMKNIISHIRCKFFRYNEITKELKQYE